MVHCVAVAAMPVRADRWSHLSLALAALFCSFYIHSDPSPYSSGRFAPFPRLTLWAWERREDLHRIDTRRFAVAYLDQTLTVGSLVTRRPRRDLLALAASTVRIPVVRIETQPGAVLDTGNRDALVGDLLLTAREPGISAMQVDFDATRSQRPFYRDLLYTLRRQMPAGLPLSITALASWCSYDDWLNGLPVDEAVPMLFHMEPDHRRAPPDLDDFQIREPLCQASVGVSTAEPWPSHPAGKRLYIFSDRGWEVDSPADVMRRLE
jgi:hypothetical protein